MALDELKRDARVKERKEMVWKKDRFGNERAGRKKEEGLGWKEGLQRSLFLRLKEERFIANLLCFCIHFFLFRLCSMLTHINHLNFLFGDNRSDNCKWDSSLLHFQKQQTRSLIFRSSESLSFSPPMMFSYRKWVLRSCTCSLMTTTSTTRLLSSCSKSHLAKVRTKDEEFWLKDK